MVISAAAARLPAELATLAARIAAAMAEEAARVTGAGCMPQISAAAVSFSRVIDPENKLPGYEGIWRNTRNARCGSLTFNSDGSFYAEYDLFCPHPHDARWFVEMVTAWGKADTLRVEAQLIPVP